jgi:hypothetical protein
MKDIFLLFICIMLFGGLFHHDGLKIEKIMQAEAI